MNRNDEGAAGPERLAEVAPQLAEALLQLNDRLHSMRFEAGRSQSRKALEAALATMPPAEEFFQRRPPRAPVVEAVTPEDEERWARALEAQENVVRALAARVLDLQEQFVPLFERQRLALAGLVHKPLFACGCYKEESACAVLHSITRGRSLFTALANLPLGTVDWDDPRGPGSIRLVDDGELHELVVGVRVEVAELRREHAVADETLPWTKQAEDRHGLTSTAYVFLRVLVEADGEPLDFQGIFLAAQKKDAATFKGAQPNRRQQETIRRLVGHRHGGKVVRGTGGRGRRCEFWIEQAR